MPKYPKIVVRISITGEEGNAFVILGRVVVAMREHGVPQREIDDYLEEATQSDYNNLLKTTHKWVKVVKYFPLIGKKKRS